MWLTADPSARPSLLRVTIATVRMILTAAVLVTLYYVVPMDFTDTNASTFVRLLVGAGIFVGLMSWQLREITRADYPALRAFEALFLVRAALPALVRIDVLLDGQIGSGRTSANR